MRRRRKRKGMDSESARNIGARGDGEAPAAKIAPNGRGNGRRRGVDNRRDLRASVWLPADGLAASILIPSGAQAYRKAEEALRLTYESR